MAEVRRLLMASWCLLRLSEQQLIVCTAPSTLQLHPAVGHRASGLLATHMWVPPSKVTWVG